MHQIFAVNSCHVSSNTSPGLLPKSYHLHHQTPIPISCSLSRCSENCFIHYLICRLRKVHYLLREERWENGVVPFFETSVQEVWSNFTQQSTCQIETYTCTCKLTIILISVLILESTTDFVTLLQKLLFLKLWWLDELCK